MNRNRQVVLSVALAALLVLAGCVGGDDGSTTATFSTRDTTETTSATTDAPNTYALGETVELQQENTTIAVAVLDYRLVDAYDAPDESGGTQTVESAAGEQFLLVKVSAENVGSAHGSTPGVSVRPTNASFDGDGPLPSWASEGLYLNVRPLPAGESRTGWVLVQTDAGSAADVRVAFSTDLLITDGEYRWTLEEQ